MLPSRTRRSPSGPHRGKPSDTCLDPGQETFPPEAESCECGWLLTRTSQSGQAPSLCLWAGSRLPSLSPDNPLGLPGPSFWGLGDLELRFPYPVPQQVIDWTLVLLLMFGDVHSPNLNILRPASLAAVGFRVLCPLRLTL